jgi:hypothetical protein
MSALSGHGDWLALCKEADAAYLENRDKSLTMDVYEQQMPEASMRTGDVKYLDIGNDFFYYYKISDDMYNRMYKSYSEIQKEAIFGYTLKK